jgi:hypothetical protein
MASGDVLILACPEMYSENNTLERMVSQCTGNYMVIPRGLDDRKNVYKFDGNYFDLYPLNTKLPFFMAVRKCDWNAIGGYDEAMTGISFDDDDFVARMQDIGASYVQSDAIVIHLYHPRISDTVRNNPENRERWLFNKAMFDAKRAAKNML